MYALTLLIAFYCHHYCLQVLRLTIFIVFHRLWKLPRGYIMSKKYATMLISSFLVWSWKKHQIHLKPTTRCLVYIFWTINMASQLIKRIIKGKNTMHFSVLRWQTRADFIGAKNSHLFMVSFWNISPFVWIKYHISMRITRAKWPLKCAHRKRSSSTQKWHLGCTWCGNIMSPFS